MCELHLKEHAAMTILTAEPPDPFGYGRIVIKTGSSNEVQAIVEQKSLTEAQLKNPQALREINSGIYAFNTEKLFAHLDNLDNKNSAGEYYLTDVAAMLVAANEKVIATKAEDINEVLGANTIAEMMALDAALRAATVAKLMSQGVTIFRPETVTIDLCRHRPAPTPLSSPFVQLLGYTAHRLRLPHPLLLRYSELAACR